MTLFVFDLFTELELEWPIVNNNMVFLLPLIIIAIFLEGTVTALPLVLLCLLCLTIFRRDGIVFPIAFFAGLLLDTVLVNRLGGASIFFLIFVFLILLYQRKYEINSYPFVFFSSFLGSILFLLLFGYGLAIGQSFIASFIAVFLFGVLRFVERVKGKGK